MSFADWETPLSESEREGLLSSVSTAIVKRGLTVPAILALEMHKPLAFLASQGIIAATPFVGGFLGIERMQRVSKLLAEPDGVESLIRRIEQLAGAEDGAANSESGPVSGGAVSQMK